MGRNGSTDDSSAESADDSSAEDTHDSSADSTNDSSTCAESGCTRKPAVRLHVPWEENRTVCQACARSLVQQDGVVAEPLEENGDAWS